MKKGLITAAKFIIFFIGWAVLAGITEVPCEENPVVWRFFAELIPFLWIIIFTVIFLLFEKGNVKLPVMTNLKKGFVIGTVSGIVWTAVPSALLMTTGLLSIAEKNQIDNLWLWIISAFINVCMQELLIRGYLYQLIKERHNSIAAVFITSSLFTFIHGGAFEAGIIAVINVFTMSLFVSMLYESEDTIIAPIMAHAVWNIIGAIFLGEVSLADDYPNLYSVTTSDNVLLSGGEYKIEASIIVMFINIILTVIFFYKNKSKKITDY